MTLRFGILGAGGRGGTFREAIEAHGATIRAVCDADLYDTGALEAAQDRLGAAEAYHDYNAMLVESDLDAVLVGTPVQHHVTHTVAALRRDLHVLSEVPAGAGTGECRDLVAAAERSAGTYAMAENYIFMRPNELVTALVEDGRFGDPYYAEGEYLHELKGLQERTTWRRVWGSDRPGITYPTHSLGPVLQWFPDRVTRVCLAEAGHRYEDPRDDSYRQADTVVMLCETAGDRLAKIRFDTLSERPHAMANYQLQGTAGAYESARAPGETNRVWLADDEDADRSGEYEWRDLEAYADYLPERWREAPAEIQEDGHGGGDYFAVGTFVDAVESGEDPPVGIHEAMDMTLPGLASVESAHGDGEWVAVPDSRDW